jgi:DNA-binding HxlR family transcriptional regulator
MGIIKKEGSVLNTEQSVKKGGKENFEQIFDTEGCPVRQILDRFSDKWSLLVLLVLDRKGILRFNELAGLIGDVSQKMLTSTLRTLESNGLVSRKLYPEIPPRVEYRLTALGESMVPHVDALRGWAIANAAAILKTRKKYEKAHA